MAGSSIATPAAAAWVTDFLNAAYYARPENERDAGDLRLAHGILTSYWATRRGRLGLRHLIAMNRAFGARRVRDRGRLDHEALLAGGRALLGDWFEQAWQDPDRRAHGIAFETRAQRVAFDPARRLRRAALKALSPPRDSPDDQHWATYDPVLLPDAQAALALIADPARWPDMGSANGRFTALRPGGLKRQTFEIEVAAEPVPRSPVFTRGYVTCTTAHLAEGLELESAVAELALKYERGSGGTDRILPGAARPLALVVLTTHEGHFLGRGLSHLLVWQDTAGVWIRDVGAWDPLPPHLAVAYSAFGRKAQREFWGPEPAQRSMLAQLAIVS
ncbi:MAG TPA: hypothetical protein VNT22_00890 [Baekduia sp.]|nr:hypothetical protein [Baekduia sp.]